MKDELQKLIDVFTAGVVALGRKEALRVVSEALLVPGVEVRSAVERTAAQVPKKSGVGRVGGAKPGEKRTPKVIADLKKRIVKTLGQEHPEGGWRIEPLAKDLGVPTSELVLPLKQLIAAHTINTVGERRATMYSLTVVGQRAKKRAKSKKGKKS